MLIRPLEFKREEEMSAERERERERESEFSGDALWRWPFSVALKCAHYQVAVYHKNTSAFVWEAKNNKSHHSGDQPLCIFYLSIQHGPPDRFINDYNHISKDACPKRLTML